MEWITENIGNLNEPLTASQLIIGFIIYYIYKTAMALTELAFKMYYRIRKEYDN